MFFANLNYISIAIATVAGMMVGYVWYSKWLFGPMWLRAKGQTSETAQPNTSGKKMSVQFGFMTLSTLATAFVISALFNSLIIVSIGGIVLTAVLLWLGFSVPMKLGDKLFGSDSCAFFLISVGQELAAIIVMSLIIGLFR